ncbi:MAG: RDD family protein [Marmoricola sp.]
MSNQAKKPTTSAPKPPPGLEPAGWGRRFAALFIDWLASSLVLIAVAGPSRYSGPHGTTLILPIMIVEIVVFTVLVGGSFGQIALRLRVRRLDGARLSPWAVLVRSLLIALVIPPLVYRPDGRGLHDLAVNSATFRAL